jgi:protein CpxP
MKMKNLIIALVFGIGLTGFAQEATPKPNRANMEKLTPEQRQEKQLAHLTKELTLDAKQQIAVGKILSEQSAKMQEMKNQKETRKASGAKMTNEERTAFKNAMQTEKTNTETKMKAILTTDQYKKWEVMRAENAEKIKEKKRERKDGI